LIKIEIMESQIMSYTCTDNWNHKRTARSFVLFVGHCF
jgi:hypothetical protein